ncbi:exostosin domain-containing protein [Aequorivita xiaoshiensis]|uniref:Glycosyltransferase family 47 protein n=1 Tax=Aequorivita xiaoshiensis TaxID=2874476 RepID=A0A9X1R3Q6_9FLAO|nr:exostosin family protein [Aequorivita xiaoshiensis]MCG2430479.1 glycosyltransferase family 47 protein [Aequorivita xiaoshiensis]
MKLYYPKAHYDKSSRGQLFPLLKPFIKGDDFTDAQRIQVYGVSEKDFEFTDKMEEADLVILTMAWNYYVNTNNTNLAVSQVKKAESFGKKIIIWNLSDFGIRIPYYKNSIILRRSGYKSKFKNNEYSLSSFIDDPLQKYFNTSKVPLNSYNPIPIIGFCGQANHSLVNAKKEIFNTVLRNLKFYTGLTLFEPQQILSTSFLRASVLNTFQESNNIVSNFIFREKYRAGVTKNKDTHLTTIEFYNNLKNSDYIVCVRGAGNFSVRFYEALAMGRIPVFINTDCSLPFNDSIDWKKHLVWVEYKDRHLVVQKVLDFHNNLSALDFVNLQYSNRKLWEEKLTLGGFFREFLNFLNAQ